MDTKQLSEQIQTTFFALQDAVERKADQSTIDRLNRRMDELETANKRMPFAGMSAANYDPPKEPNKEYQLFFKMVAAKGPQGLEVATQRAEAEALQDRISQKLYGMGERERKALALGDDTLGRIPGPARTGERDHQGHPAHLPRSAVRQRSPNRSSQRHGAESL